MSSVLESLENSNKYDFEYFSLSSLKHRGWTDSKIKLWLKEPDKLVDNPHYRNAAPSKLYEAIRVKELEESSNFKEWLENAKKGREKQSKKQLKIHNDKRKELLKYIKGLKIKIKKINEIKLYKDAINHYNRLWINRDEDYKVINCEYNELEKHFLNRITINMLRHNNEHYEKELEKMFGKTGKDYAYNLLKEKINNQILKVFPFLKEEVNV